MGVLANTSPSGSPMGSVLLWVGVLMAVVIVASVVLLRVRRRMLSDDAHSNTGGLMEELRASVRRGEMTQAEYDSTVRAIALRMRSNGESDHRHQTRPTDAQNKGGASPDGPERPE